jgi:TRAP-type C4-dicarboxylate transport system permease large subunit
MVHRTPNISLSIEQEGLMYYLCYLCLLEYSGVQRFVLLYVFIVLCWDVSSGFHIKMMFCSSLTPVWLKVSIYIIINILIARRQVWRHQRRNHRCDRQCNEFWCVWGLMYYLCYLCLLEYSGIQRFVLLYVFIVLCWDVSYGFHIKMMFCSSLTPVDCTRARILYMLFVFFCTVADISTQNYKYI